MVQVVEYLLGKYKALVSKINTIKREKNHTENKVCSSHNY
jgi:hypothetical protein